MNKPTLLAHQMCQTLQLSTQAQIFQVRVWTLTRSTFTQRTDLPQADSHFGIK